MVEHEKTEPDKTAWLHDLAAEDVEGAHAVAEEEEQEEFSGGLVS